MLLYVEDATITRVNEERSKMEMGEASRSFRPSQRVV